MDKSGLAVSFDELAVSKFRLKCGLQFSTIALFNYIII